MIEIDDKIISDDVLEKKFVCDLTKCKGACCIEGDAGAPLEADEVKILEDIYPTVKSEMREEGILAVEKHGVFYKDEFGEPVTTLVNNKECAFVVFDKNNIAKCAIEIAHQKNKINFIKPVSCHLFPIRVKNYESFQGINIHDWHVCKPACECCQKLKVPVFKFLKSAIIRKWGLEFYNQLNQAFEQFFSKK